jgi:hypothetical protein
MSLREPEARFLIRQADALASHLVSGLGRPHKGLRFEGSFFLTPEAQMFTPIASYSAR